jgi:hypothetical protein
LKSRFCDETSWRLTRWKTGETWMPRGSDVAGFSNPVEPSQRSASATPAEAAFAGLT